MHAMRHCKITDGGEILTYEETKLWLSANPSLLDTATTRFCTNEKSCRLLEDLSRCN